MSEIEKYESECAHPPCGCAVDEAGKYCSEWCKKELITTDCGCGHVECRGIGSHKN